MNTNNIDNCAVDATETRRERPKKKKKKQKKCYSGKKKAHTNKTQLIIDIVTLIIYRISFCEGSVHDFKLFKSTYTGISKDIKVLADSGYQGIDKIHKNSETPKKASKKHPLTKEEKEKNRNLSKKRIYIEHVNRFIKRFKIISTVYRNKGKKFKLRMSLICGIYNYEQKKKVTEAA